VRHRYARFLALLLAVLASAAGPARAERTMLAPGEPLTAARVRELVEAALPTPPPGRRLELSIAEPKLPLANPSDRPVFLVLDGLELDEARRRFTAKLVVRVDDRVTGILGLAGAVRALVEVPAPLQPLRDGQLVEPELLGTVWIPESALAPDTVLAAEEIVGREAGRRVPAGRPLRESDLRAPRLVRKGELVTLVFQRGPIELTARGRALEDGGEGERIRAVNVDSERPVSGVVIGRRHLLVGLPEGAR
jgi:flagella basal body P-ring formation protein FlgA